MNEIKVYTKMVPETFVVINGNEFIQSELLSTLNTLLMYTKENDKYGDYSIHDYDVDYPDVMDKLVEMGLVKNYIGSRMAHLFCIKDKEEFEKFTETVWNACENLNKVEE